MADPRIIYLLISSLEAALGIALAWLFLRYWRQLERPYLRLWSGSFAALAVYLTASSVAFLLTREQGQPLGLRNLFTLISQLAAYLHIGLLVMGTLSLLGRRDAPAFLLRAVIGSSVLLGLMASLMFAWDPDGGSGRIFMRITLRYLVATAAYAGVAMALLGAAQQRGIGQRLTGLGFAFIALTSLTGVLITTVPDLGRAVGNGAVWLALFDLVAIAGIGIGLFVWLHDEERTRSQSATHALEEASFFDPATRLPNRRLLSRRLAEQFADTAGSGSIHALLVLRVDRCSRLREAIGDAEFDVLLMQIAQQIDAMSGSATSPTARLEDDRLALLITQCDVADCTDRADRVLRMVSEGFTQRAGFSTFSAGLAHYPVDAANPAALINAAVSAQARAELAGGNRLSAFSAELRRRERDDLNLVAALHRAIAGDELRLHLQPVIALDSAQASYHEALIRWQHPERGLLTPESFLPLAEDAGLLPQLDHWVMREGCRMLAKSDDPCSCIAVNLTAPTFLAAGFGETLAALLQEHGLAGKRLIVEITEAIAVDDPIAAKANLERLRALGVRVALDDVGTGFSSLDQLQRLSFDILKVDRVFVTDIGRTARDAAVARALITLGRSLGLLVVVEGIENESQLAFARSEGAQYAQGYLVGGPQPAPTAS